MKKKVGRPGYGDVIWISLRKAYEAGMYDGPKAFWEGYVKQLKESDPKRYPTYSVLANKIYDNRWISGAALAASADVVRAQRALTLEAYAKHGLTTDKAAQILADGAMAAERSYERLRDEVLRLAEKDARLDSESISIMLRMVQDHINDMRFGVQYLAEYHKVVGAYAPVKKANMNLNLSVTAEDAPAALLKAKERIARYEQHLDRRES